MRLGGPVEEFNSPETWIRALRAKGYRAGYCPVGPEADAGEVSLVADFDRKDRGGYPPRSLTVEGQIELSENVYRVGD